MAMLISEAGGKATDGQQDILNIDPIALHQRVSLIFGSTNEVDAFMSYSS
jgi:fructose-1,6-bisphosphatase I